MTTGRASAQDVSVRTFLLGDRSTGGDVDRLAQAIDEDGIAGAVLHGAGGLDRAARTEFTRQLADAISPLLDIDLGDILILGWTKQRDVMAAARRTVKAPGSPETVYLASHEITSTHHPLVDLLVDGVRLHTFTFEVTVAVELAGGALRIQDGRLLDARCGRATVTAELRLENMHRPLVRAQRHLEPRPALRFGNGIRLVNASPSGHAAGKPPAWGGTTDEA